MNGTVLSGSEIVHAILVLREINTQTTCVNKCHATLLIAFNTAKYILLVWIGFSL